MGHWLLSLSTGGRTQLQYSSDGERKKAWGWRFVVKKARARGRDRRTLSHFSPAHWIKEGEVQFVLWTNATTRGLAFNYTMKQMNTGHTGEWNTSVKINTTFLRPESGVSFLIFRYHHFERHLLRLDRSFFSDSGGLDPSSLWLALTSSHELLCVGLRHWLLHLRDHQVCGGEELVCGHHQPDCTATHHRIFCRVCAFFSLPVHHRFDFSDNNKIIIIM